LADTYSLLAYYGYLPPNEAERKAKEAVEKALSINPNLVEARISRAWIAMTFDWDWIAAEDIFRDVIEKKTRYATAYQWYSFYLMARQRTQESLDLILEAQRLEPHPPVINKSVGQRYFHARQYAQAVERFEEALNLEPGSSMILYWLGLGYEQQALQAKRAGRHPEARARLEQARQTFEDARNATVAEAGGAARKARPDPAILAALGHLHAVSGNPTQARRILRDLERLRAERYVSPVAVAILNAGLGDRAAAIRNLKTAHAQRSPELTLLKIEPRFEPLRAEPEFRQLLSKVFPD
jgi:tetratricopeptide (TPR) repeat protein